MAHNNTIHSPTTTTDRTLTMIPSSISSCTYLTIPNSGARIARSSSHESFATDISLVSLSSFTSELPNRVRVPYDKDDDPDSDRCDQSLARCREDMLEKMLETHAFVSLFSKGGNSKFRVPVTTKSKCIESGRFGEEIEKGLKYTNGITDSEEELLMKCSQNEPRTKGSLYKSFSTSDVLSLSDSFFIRAPSYVTEGETNFNQSRQCRFQNAYTNMKSCVSQSWLPNDYARASERRKRNLQYFKPMCLNKSTFDDECNENDNRRDQAEDSQDAQSPSSASRTPQAKQSGSKRIGHAWNRKSKQFDTNISEESVNYEPRRSSSDAGASSKQMLLKKFNLPKEIGSRIRDDLMEKLSKHKQQNMSITKSDLERDKGRPLTRVERNFIIFHWLQSLDDECVANT